MRSTVRFVVWAGAILGAIGLLLYLFVFDTWVVPGDDPMFTASILPTLAPGDRVLVRRDTMPLLGQLARCVSPVDGRFVVGRVFGMERDTVEIKQEYVSTDNQRTVARFACPPVTLTHPATGQLLTLGCGVEENGAWSYGALHASESWEPDHSAIVEAGKLFIVSDDRHLHQDSRDFGQVDASHCEHIVYRLWGNSYLDHSRRNNILW
jgi:signal peptidase I